jgi:hypothetical protein
MLTLYKIYSAMPVLLKSTGFSLSPVKFLFGAILLIFLSSCKNSSQNNSAPTIITTENITTSSVLGASMHSLHLPFTDTCYDTVATQRSRLPDSLSQFKQYGKIVGKINETGKYVAVLYAISADVQLPVIHTFNTNGEKISSLKLFIGNCCGENEACSGLSTVRITKDLHIILKDSMQTFDRDKKKFDKKRNIKVVKKYEEFKIDSTGTILKVSSGD